MSFYVSLCRQTIAFNTDIEALIFLLHGGENMVLDDPLKHILENSVGVGLGCSIDQSTNLSGHLKTVGPGT